ncbi:MAG: hypothetical protein IK026_02040 [Eubacteriaceae bacterium]|nr:hypothetical protein [Eubacteriaceae bacterium]
MLSYKDYVKAKKICHLDMQLFAVSIYAMVVLVLLQGLFLVYKMLFPYSFLELIILNKIFSMAYVMSSRSNTVFAFLLYAAFCTVLIGFAVCGVCSAFASKIRFPFYFYFPIAVYAADSIFCLATGELAAFTVHIVLISLALFAVKYQRLYFLIGSDLWG